MPKKMGNLKSIHDFTHSWTTGQMLLKSMPVGKLVLIAGQGDEVPHDRQAICFKSKVQKHTGEKTISNKQDSFIRQNLDM